MKINKDELRDSSKSLDIKERKHKYNKLSSIMIRERNENRKLKFRLTFAITLKSMSSI